MMKARLRSARCLKEDVVDAKNSPDSSSRCATRAEPKSANARPTEPRVAAKRKPELKRTEAENPAERQLPVTNVTPAAAAFDAQQEPTSSKTSKRAGSAPFKIEYSHGPRHETDKTSPYFPWVPKNWEEVLANVRKMRQAIEAPVDTMGCDKCVDQSVPQKLVRYQLLVSLMLSSQTKDEVTHAAVGRLREFSLTPESMAAANEKHIEQLIYPVSFYKNKAKHLKQTAKVLLEKYDGDIPDSVESLCSLPGVGPKMAYLAMSCGWGHTVGIGVDTHVHRISNRLGWLPAPTKTPEQTRKALEAWLPRELWDEVNHLLVGFGQTVCKPVGPKCSTCLNMELCPFGRKQGKGSRKKALLCHRCCTHYLHPLSCLAQGKPEPTHCACFVASPADVSSCKEGGQTTSQESTLGLVVKTYFGVNFDRQQPHLEVGSSTLTMYEARSSLLKRCGCAETRAIWW
ncbi:endonuclease III-like protein 1 isoform X3 [Dermacentor albipictus]|uniref:endonuclease III-like protein 1 isoform X3 n=1 Tax=Dermacentor albipictus TaxID=60249 RepID=UPI0038FC2938